MFFMLFSHAKRVLSCKFLCQMIKQSHATSINVYLLKLLLIYICIDAYILLFKNWRNITKVVAQKQIWSIPYLLLHDNAPVHKARIVTKYLLPHSSPRPPPQSAFSRFSDLFLFLLNSTYLEKDSNPEVP